MKRQHSAVSLHTFWFWASTQNIHKDNKNSDLVVEETEYMPHNICGWYLNDSGLEGGNKTSTGHIVM